MHRVLRGRAPAFARILSAAAAAMAAGAGMAGDAVELSALGLEDLMEIEVTSVSRKAQRFKDTAAAVFVITGEDIRRSGATSIPEALRMAPGMQVARLAGNTWAVSARGFAGRFSNKLLVQVDGRSLYSPLFSGVMWEAQDMLLEDIDRIEVIRGPGAALWGANAVNGIVNIITKRAKDTQGGYADLAVGTREKGIASVRYGGQAGQDTAYRLYGRAHYRDSSVGVLGEPAADSSRSWRSGFRLDRILDPGARLTVIGDGHEAHSGERWTVPQVLPPYGVVTPLAERNRSTSLLGRYERDYADGSSTAVQAYYDTGTLGATPFVFESRDTLDLDFQRRLPAGSRHDVIWGVNYRMSRDRVTTPGFITLAPSTRTFELWSAFVHDDIALVPDRLRLILGVKIEHNSFTGLEPQPNVRMLWRPAEDHVLWVAASRAARIPSRSERDAAIDLKAIPPLSPGNPAPLPTLVRSVMEPGNALVSEKVNAFEAGYRTQLARHLSLDVALFSNRYTHLRSVHGGPVLIQGLPVPYVLQQVYVDNALAASTRGVEASADWRLRSSWRMQASYSWLDTSFPLSGDPGRDDMARMLRDSAPRHQWSVRSLLDVAPRHQFDLWLRRVSALGWGVIPAYTTVDARYAWQARKDLELSLVGQNLLDSAHPEFQLDLIPAPQNQTRRAAYVRARMGF